MHRRGWLAQLVRAPALQAGCRGFESLTAHQKDIYAVQSRLANQHNPLNNQSLYVFFRLARYHGILRLVGIFPEVSRFQFGGILRRNQGVLCKWTRKRASEGANPAH